MACVLWSVPGASASPHPDDARWWAGFGAQGPLGPGVVHAAVEFHGDYYIGGAFTLSTPDGIAKNLARWDGRRWRAVPGSPGGIVYALCVVNEGAGSALLVGGVFATVNVNQTVNHIARWDGKTWSALAMGMTVSGGGFQPSVEDIETFDSDGDGPAPARPVAVGAFTHAGGVLANGVAMWDGAGWSALDVGFAATSGAPRAYAIRTWDPDGPGVGTAPPRLVVGGQFSSAGGAPATNIAKWDGGAWSGMGGLAGGSVAFVCRALEVIDTGTGDRLIAGGLFTTAGGVSVSNLAAWDGANWASIGGVSQSQGVALVESLLADIRTNPPTLLVGGQFASAGGVPASNIARYTGSAWMPVSGGLTGESSQSGTHVYLLGLYDEGCGPVLFAGGSFTHAGESVAVNLARYEASAGWSPMLRDTRGLGLAAPVASVCAFDDGAGPRMHAFGSFSLAGETDVAGAARWEGDHWAPMGTGLFPRSGNGCSLVHDDGSGPALYVGQGALLTAGGVAVKGLAKWNGVNWSGVGPISTGSRGVLALCKFDDGAGPRPALYAGGNFTDSGGVPTLNIARWDGASWSALGSGAPGGVTSMCVYDDGDGPALYVGGSFGAAGGVTSNRIARWSGSAWSAVGDGVGLQGGTPGTPTAMAVFDEDGPGPGEPALFVAGSFFTAGGVSAAGLARWNGSLWSAVVPTLSGLDGVRVNRLLTFDNGGGPRLFLAGNFLTAGGAPMNHVAQWDGGALTPLGSGLAGGEGTALGALGSELWVGGTFAAAGGKPSAFVARFGATPFAPPVPFASGGAPSAIVAANFDRDPLNRPDLGVANADTGEVALLFNSAAVGGGASFTPPSPTHTHAVGDLPRALASADFDGVNGADIAVVCALSDTLVILTNQGDGRMSVTSTLPAGDEPVGVVAADLNGDESPDLAVVARGDQTLRIYHNTGSGSFDAQGAQAGPSGPGGVGEGDLDNDKDVDIVTGSSEGLAVYSNGSGTRGFDAPVVFPISLCGDAGPLDVVVRDVNGDGLPDVICANSADDSIVVLLNAGAQADGVWAGLLPPRRFDAGVRPAALAVADFFGDGLAHIVSANAPLEGDATLSVFRNVTTSPEAFALEPAIESPAPDNPSDAVATDLNRDGRPDLALAGGSVLGSDGPAMASVHVLLNTGEGALPTCPGDANGDRIVDFLDLNLVLSHYGQTGPALPGDLDADGDVDFVDLNAVLSAYGSAC